MQSLPTELYAETAKNFIAAAIVSSRNPCKDTVALRLVSKKFKAVIDSLTPRHMPQEVNLGAMKITSDEDLERLVRIANTIPSYIKKVRVRLQGEIVACSRPPWDPRVFNVGAGLQRLGQRGKLGAARRIRCTELDLECDYIWQWAWLFEWGLLTKLNLMTRVGNHHIYTLLRSLNPAILTSLSLLLNHDPFLDPGRIERRRFILVNNSHIDTPRISFPHLESLTIVTGLTVDTRGRNPDVGEHVNPADHEQGVGMSEEDYNTLTEALFDASYIIDYIHAPVLEDLTIVQTPWHGDLLYINASDLESLLLGESDARSEPPATTPCLRSLVIQDIDVRADDNHGSLYAGVRQILQCVNGSLETFKYAPFTSGFAPTHQDTEFLAWLFPSGDGTIHVPRSQWLPRLRNVEVVLEASLGDDHGESRDVLEEMFSTFLEERTGQCNGSLAFLDAYVYGIAPVDGPEPICSCPLPIVRPGAAFVCTQQSFPIAIHGGLDD